MKVTEYRFGRSFDIELAIGEDIRAAVAALCRNEGVETGVLTSGLGGFDRFCLSFPNTPSRDVRSWNGQILQLSAVQGFVSDGVPEIYATVTVDGSDPLTWSGRVEDGTARKFYCEMMLTELLPVSAKTSPQGRAALNPHTTP